MIMTTKDNEILDMPSFLRRSNNEMKRVGRITLVGDELRYEGITVAIIEEGAQPSILSEFIEIMDAISQERIHTTDIAKLRKDLVAVVDEEYKNKFPKTKMLVLRDRLTNAIKYCLGEALI